MDDETLDLVDESLRFLGDKVRHDSPLGSLTTYRVGGSARRLVEVADVDELIRIARALGALDGLDDQAVMVIGRGSNMLVADRGVDAVVLRLGDGFDQISVTGSRVRAGAAVSLPVLARRTVAENLSGFEWAVGVPGSVGGAVRMNAGGHGSEMSSSLVGVRVVDVLSGEDVSVQPTSLDLGYRRSSLRRSQVVAHADFQLSPSEDPAASRALLSEIVRWRRENQPGGQNAGSVFTNPAGDSAGRLIDSAGGRGLRVRTAAVSDKHANFIQADPDGSADDVAAVMAALRRLVMQRHGVQLHPETVLVGFTPQAMAELTGPVPTGDAS